MSNGAKHVQMQSEPTLHSLMSELKAQISKELQGFVVEKPVAVKEIADYYSVSEDTIYRWMREGSIPFHKLQGRTYFYASECRQSLLKR